jgi:hypothetical protein
MAKSPEPVVLDLAALAREQMGPFLMLGLDKTADKTTIEKHWADRVKWARRSLVKVALEDVNWARDLLSDVERRIKYDASSLNADTSDGVITQLAERFGLEGGQATRQWQPLDSEKALADYVPSAEVPEIETVRGSLQVPALPEDVPAVPSLLERLAGQPLDPWALELPPADGRAAAPHHSQDHAS